MSARCGRRVVFVGISTTGSVLHRAFPAWMEILRHKAVLDTVDIPACSPARSYRALMTALRDDPDVAGAVITAHKTAMYEHARDLLAGVDETGERFREISVVHRGASGLLGTVVEPSSIATTLKEMGGGSALTRPAADVVVFGAGGTAASLIACLTDPAWPDAARPRTLRLVDVCARRLRLTHCLATKTARPLVARTLHSPGQMPLSDVGSLAPGTLIINATGLGKDRPGSPLTLPTSWPHQAHVWDLNYRGDLRLLRAARQAPTPLRLTVHDGWTLLIHSWTQALALIFGRDISHDERHHMHLAAQAVR